VLLKVFSKKTSAKVIKTGESKSEVNVYFFTSTVSGFSRKLHQRLYEVKTKIDDEFVLRM